MEVSKERLDELRDILRDQLNREPTDEEVSECARTLIGFAEIIYDSWKTEQHWKRKLEENPKGFPLEDSGRSCCICRVGTSPENSWYDKHGIKCLHCQRALEKRVIPVSITNDWDRKTWFTAYDLQSKLGIRHMTMKKLIREGKLKARVIKDKSDNTYFYVFLVKENQEWIKQKNG